MIIVAISGTSRWNDGTNVLQVNGLQVDGASSPGVATTGRPWAMLVSDSIGEAYGAAAGSQDFLYGYFGHLMYLLDTLGYDTCISACGGSGWLHQGDSPATVPGYYIVSGSTNGVGGTYSDATSRWNKIDNGVSLLDASGRISSYGAVNTSPSLIVINYMVNDCLNAMNLSDCQASVTQCLTALRYGAPSAWIVLIVPFSMYLYSTGPTYITALKNGVIAYQAANPSDTKVTLLDFGSNVSTTLSSSVFMNGDTVHPVAAGHSLMATLVANKLSPLLTGSSIPRYTHV